MQITVTPPPKDFLVKMILLSWFTGVNRYGEVVPVVLEKVRINGFISKGKSLVGRFKCSLLHGFIALKGLNFGECFR